MDKLIQDGLDRALQDAVGTLYGVLMTGLHEKSPDQERQALERYRVGLRLAMRTYVLAKGVQP